MRSTNEAKCFSKAPSGAFFVPCGHLPGLWAGVVGAGDNVPRQGGGSGLHCRPLQGAMRPRRGRLFRQPPTAGAASPRADGRVRSCERVAMVTVDQRGDPPDPACAAWRRDRVTLNGTPRHAARRGPPHTCSGFRPSAYTPGGAPAVCRPSGLIGCCPGRDMVTTPLVCMF